MFYLLLKSLLLPPGCLVVLLALSIVVVRRRPRLSFYLVCLSLVLFCLLSNLYVGQRVMAWLQPDVALSETALVAFRPQAIVVLGADRLNAAPEYGGRDTAGSNLLVRLRYAAKLHRETGLPILVSSGPGYENRESQGDTMAEILEQEFQVPVQWRETGSLTTWQNAAFSAPVLASAGVERILLVTHAFHMRRSVETFEYFGLDVLPAPTGFMGRGGPTPEDFLPSVSGLLLNQWALHEVLGLWYYRWRYFRG